MKNNKIKNKKSLSALALLLGIGIVVGTGAFYNATESGLHNHKYENSVKFAYELDYDSTSDTIKWASAEEKDFIATLENTGEVNFAVRFKVNETWKDKATDAVIDPESSEEIAKLYDSKMFRVNESDWTKKDDGYYYYNSVLTPSDKIEKFIEKLVNDTSNSGAAAIRTNTYDTEGESVNSVITYETGDNYVYEPTITVEMVEAGYDWNA